MLLPVPAYLDPTSGSIAFQVAISSALALAAAGRLYWDKLKKLFAGRPPATDNQPPG